MSETKLIVFCIAGIAMTVVGFGMARAKRSTFECCGAVILTAIILGLLVRAFPAEINRLIGGNEWYGQTEEIQDEPRYQHGRRQRH